ncbi:MAG: hypothetical protein QF561_05320 [Phycisphaerales bacterium]|jgi:hypothetical protein|nr:hypothetical protein [Phycisphaerales bacterium]
MAKMFYTLAEVCQRLGKTEAEVEAMVEAREIQEFRDGENLVFKVEQIDLLAPGEDMDLDIETSGLDLDDSFDLGGSETGSIGLAESQSAQMPVEEASSMSAADTSGSVLGLGSSSMQSAPGVGGDDLDLSAELEAPVEGSDASASVSAFDGAVGLDDGGDTQLGEGLDDDLTLESVGSGSGLLDLTRESDDTSLGAELLEEVYSSDDEVDFPAASGLFEASKEETPSGGPAVAPAPAAAAQPTTAAPIAVAAQSWDPSWSGLSAGMMIGGLVALMAVFAMTVVEVMGGASGIAQIISGDFWIWVGGLAGGTVLLGLIGWLIGSKSG